MKKLLRLILLAFMLLSYYHSTWSQDEITAKDLASHLNFLASDSLKGRKPGTMESSIAAQYIADEFKQYGLKLLGNNGFQYFNVTSGVKAGTNSLKFEKKNYAFEKDFTVLSYSENAKIKSAIVFVGYGFDIQKDELKWDDYQNMDVKGKWVMILRGNPDMDKQMSQFSSYGDERAKILTAKDKGAAGVIFVSPNLMDKEDNLLPVKMGRGDVKCGLPAVQIKRELADLILTKSAKTIKTMEESLNESKKPLSIDLKTDIEIKTEVDYISIKTQNVLAMLEGSDPVLKSEYILLGAHYDHLGFGGPGSGSRMPDTVAIHNGADDNASGVATVLEIAQYLASKKSELKRSVVFMAFGAEEIGLLGSQYYVNNPILDLKNAVAMFNFDMVGRLNQKTLELSIGGTGTSKEWEEILNQFQQNTKLKFAYSKEGYGPSDHASFYAHNIPVIYFNTGIHQDYHTPDDDADRINFEGQQELSSLVSQIAVQVCNMNNKLTFQEAGPKERTSGKGELKVKLGIMPGFASSDNNGLKVEGVTKDGPAYNAGLLTGDIITAINGEKISNIYDYMNRLKKFRSGDRISIDVLRANETKVFIIDL